MPIPPDLAIEVISPNDLAYHVEAKVEEYLANGYPLIWAIDPNTRTVVIHRADGPDVVLLQLDQITGASALPGSSCTIAEFSGPVARAAR